MNSYCHIMLSIYRVLVKMYDICSNSNGQSYFRTKTTICVNVTGFPTSIFLQYAHHYVSKVVVYLTKLLGFSIVCV